MTPASYYNSASEVLLQYTATGVTHTDNAVSARIYAQQGTYAVSAVYATKKSSAVDITSVKKDELTLKDVTTEIVTDESINVGGTDYDTRTGQVTIEGDFSITYTFINWGSNTDSPRVTDYNYVLGLYYESGEYFFLQPNYSYSTAGTNIDNLTISLGTATGTVNGNWVTKMNAGQTSGGTTWVTLTIERKKNVITISTDLDRGGSFYSYQTTVIDSASDDAITLFLTARNANITSLSIANNSNEYDITGYDAYGAVGSYNAALTLTENVNSGTVSLATATSKFLDGVTLTADSTSAASFVKSGAGNTIFYLAQVRSYSAYFDGTNGGAYSSFGTSNLSVTETTTLMDAAGENFYLTVPEVAITDGRNSRANTKLMGWLDIYNAKYYEVDDVLTIPYGSSSYEIVCYADWIAESYNGGSSYDASYIETLDTSSFITTNVFDFNDLFNTYSAYLSDKGSSLTDTKTWKVSYVGGAENLFKTGGLGFLFLKSGGSPLLNVSDRATTELLWSSSLNGQYTGAYSGILSYNLVSANLLNYLFGTTGDYIGYSSSTLNGVIGKTYLGEGNYLFQYDINTGYYHFDSSKNAAFYNQADGRFYLYDFLVRYNHESSTSDFFPFNYDEATYGYDMSESHTGDTLDIDAANIDYYFGMSTSIEFYLPDDTGTYENGSYGNQTSITGYDNMVFKFMGDDDVWVFVDDELVLDLGGIHSAIYGEIDFSTGTVTVIDNATPIDTANLGQYKTYMDYCIDTTSAVIGPNNYVTVPEGKATGDVTATFTYTYTDSGSGETVTKSVGGETIGQKTTLKTIESGTHTLTIYYLERGASESNIAVYTNLSSVTYNLALSKVDESGNSLGTGAEFTFYDKNGNEVLLAETLGGSATTSTFAAGSTAYGLDEGVTYTVKETKYPDGYTSEGKYFTVYLNGNILTITVYDSSGNQLDQYTYTCTVTYDSGSGQYIYSSEYSTVTNTSTWSYVVLNSSSSMKPEISGGAVSYYTIAFSIANTKAYVIPTTGSTGIQPYILTGEVLVLSAIAGLMFIAFYQFVRRRKPHANGNKKGFRETRAGRERRSLRTRDRPKECHVTHGHARDRPKV